MRKEFRRVKKYGKAAVGKENFKKIKKIKDLNERTESLKYLIASKLELEYLDIVHRLGKKSEGSTIVSAKLSRLKSKIRLFKVSHNESDYEKVVKLIEDIKKEEF